MSDNYLKKELYELIRTDESIFDLIQESSLDGLWYWDLENPEEEWMNPKFWTVLGYDPEEMPHKSTAWKNIINKDDLKAATENFIKHCENPEHPYDQIVRYTHKNGSTVWIHCRGLAIRDKNGKPVRMLGVHNNISETIKQADEMLEREVSFRAIFDAMDDMVYIADPESFELIHANKAFMRYFGEDVIGKKCFRVLQNQGHPCPFCTNGKIFGDNLGQTYVWEHQNEFNKEWYRCSDKAIRWPDGRMVRLEIATNITERKKAEQELKYERDLFTSGPVFTIEWAPSEHWPVRMVSENVKESLGYTKEEMTADTFVYAELIHPEDLQRIIGEIMNNIAHKIDAYEQSYRLKTKSGEYRWFYDFTKLVRDAAGELTTIRGYLYDQTQQKKAEEELQVAKEKAEESDKLKTAFLHNISHEIRTPLNGILGFGSFLSRMDNSTEAKKEMLAHVKQSSNRLLNTVTNYVDMAQIVSGTMQVSKKKFLLHPFFEDVTADTRRLCAGKPIKFTTVYQPDNTDLTLESDPELISRILNALLDNAMKFTASGSICCGLALKEGFVEIFVQDTGKGIAPNKLDAIFNIFTQEDPSSTRGHEGSGLGLSIASGLVKMLGGTITVQSKEGKGSTFAFTLPYAETQFVKRTPPAKKKKEGVAVKPLVLVAEDDESNYLYLEAVLKSAGCDYLHARNGEEAVAMCKKRPDITLALMDIKMPVMNGLEATKLIRKFWPELPIIAISAYAQIGDEQRFLAAGCDGYLSKPINEETLFALIQQGLGND